MEVTSIFHVEAWDYNLFKEGLYGGNLALGCELGSRFTASAEATVLYVNQHLREGAWLRGLTFFGRWRFTDDRRVRAYLEAGFGGCIEPAHSAARHEIQLPCADRCRAEEARLTSRATFVGGLRWLHLSNASLEGRDHNPDIQTVGAYVGVSTRIR